MRSCTYIKLIIAACQFDVNNILNLNTIQLLDKPQLLQGVSLPQQGIPQLTQEISQLPQGVSQQLPLPKSGEYSAMTTEEGMSVLHH